MFAESLVQTYAAWFVGALSDYALQTEDGRYHRVGVPLMSEVLHAHLEGALTVGTYLLEADDTCRFAVFDDDTDDGLLRLFAVAQALEQVGIRSYVESSRRGGHLWVPLAVPVPAWAVRAWLLPFCPSGVEFYPKQDRRGTGIGSLIRLPLGVHRRTGQRYPFVSWQASQIVAVPLDLATVLAWLGANGTNAAPDLAALSPRVGTTYGGANPHTSQTKNVPNTIASPGTMTIADWCAAQDGPALIARYVPLDERGMGSCPFVAHHRHGVDRHPSFRVYHPATPGGWCWYCYTWDTGGNVFNFLQAFYGLDARVLWSRLLAGQQF